MHAIVLTTGVCAIKALLPALFGWILPKIYKETSGEQSLRRQEYEMKRTLDGLSMIDEFAKYAKLQRQLNKVQEQLTEARSIRMSHYLKVKLTLKYVVQVIYALILLIIIWNYKYTPAIILPSEWTVPFGSIASWPTEIAGGISISVWLFLLESSSRLIMSKLSLSDYSIK
ncbi:hypothetical protein R5R35_013645 [Gryllus longicercus]|uniref:Guided entry of tail-anchored proteins factor 1 n=1 Tax=Gryllus longicercus TaxID=2509291 RepID=A0AAN9Z8N0_9ORTH